MIRRAKHFPVALNDPERTLIDSIRMFSTDSVLKKINQLSGQLQLQDGGDQNIHGAKLMKFLFADSFRQKKEETVWITGWNLISLAYRAILYSNDYRGETIIEDQEVFLLIDFLTAYEQDLESKMIDLLKKSSDWENEFALYIKGFSGEQFHFQTDFRSFDNAARELYILFECKPERLPEIDVKTIVQEEIGLDWKQVLCSLFLAWGHSLVSPSVFDIGAWIKWDDRLSLKDFETVIQRYTTTYEEIKQDENHIERQQIYIRPFIKTQKSGTLSVSPYSNLFLYEHSVLWIVRDYYKKKHNQKFTSDFGYYFEEYVQRLFTYYDIPASRVPEDPKEKRADWAIDLCGYHFLIEQKSAVIGLVVKQPNPDINRMIDYIKRNYFDAFMQLSTTEKLFSEKECIKIVLTYEDYLYEWNNDVLFSMKDHPVEDDGLFWLVNINEFEMLLQLYFENKQSFVELVEEKVKRGKNHSAEGRSIELLLSQYGIHENKYVKNGQIDKYQNMIERLAESFLSK